MRSLEDVVHLIPTDALRLLIESGRAGQPEEWLSPEHRAAEEDCAALLKTGVWPE